MISPWCKIHALHVSAPEEGTITSQSDVPKKPPCKKATSSWESLPYLHEVLLLPPPYPRHRPSLSLSLVFSYIEQGFISGIRRVHTIAILLHRIEGSFNLYPRFKSSET